MKVASAFDSFSIWTLEVHLQVLQLAQEMV